MDGLDKFREAERLRWQLGRRIVWRIIFLKKVDRLFRYFGTNA